MDQPIIAKPTQLTTHQTLGKKVLWFFMLEASLTPFLFLLLSIIIFFITTTPVLSDTILSSSIDQYGLKVSLMVLFFAIIFEALSIFVVWLGYINYTFWLSEDSFRIKRGIFSKIEIAIPYRQIQNVDVERGIIFLIFGLSRLIILTAGQDSGTHDPEAQGYDQSEGILRAVDKKLAQALQSELLRRADTQKIVHHNY